MMNIRPKSRVGGIENQILPALYKISTAFECSNNGIIKVYTLLHPFAEMELPDVHAK
jgi:hypothetical protein